MHAKIVDWYMHSDGVLLVIIDTLGCELIKIV